MAAIIEDPRNYLAIKPVPAWEAAKDAKLKARSLRHYNLGSPTRYDMFKMNYARRHKQLTSQGFMSVCWKPYQDIGKPLELNPKELVIKSLGQENKETAKSVNNNTGQDEQGDDGVKKNSQNVNAKLKYNHDVSQSMYRRQVRSNEHLQSISKNLRTVHNTKAFVKMGHSLFRVLEEENVSKEKSSEDGMQLQTVGVGIKEIAAGNENQAKIERKKKLSVGSVSQDHSRRPATASSYETRSRPSTASSQKCTSLQDPRPRSAVGFAIAREDADISLDDMDEDDEALKYQLWRQLCALHWLIEACQLETELSTNIGLSDRMIPLAKCWNVVNPGGGKMTTSVATQERYVGIKWRRFKRITSSYQISRPPSARSRPVFSRASSIAQSLSSPTSPKFRNDSSLMSSTDRPVSPTQSSITMTGGGTADTAFDRSTTPCESERQQEEDPEDFSQYHVNLRKLLETVKDSVGKEMQLREQDADKEAESHHRLRSPVYKWAYGLYLKSTTIKSKENKSTENVGDNKVKDEEKNMEVAVPNSPAPTSREVAKIRPHTAGPTYRNRITSASTPSVTNVEQDQIALSPRTKTKRFNRPKSSPPKLALRRSAFEVKFLSEEREKNINNIKEQFREVTDLKAQQLHKDLTELNKSRCERMEKKFEAFKCPQNHMHRDLQDMRSAVSKDGEGESNKGRRKSTSATLAAKSCDWYAVLLQNTISSAFQDKMCSLVLNRLEELAASFSGWQTKENAAKVKKMRQSMVPDQKITSEGFVRVLKQLRPFELCAPDVGAAIEFVRKYVVKMSIKQFEEIRQKLLNKD